jgi:hypothetical protein
VHYFLRLLHVRPANQPTITDMSLRTKVLDNPGLDGLSADSQRAVPDSIPSQSAWICNVRRTSVSPVSYALMYHRHYLTLPTDNVIK